MLNWTWQVGPTMRPLTHDEKRRLRVRWPLWLHNVSPPEWPPAALLNGDASDGSGYVLLLSYFEDGEGNVHIRADGPDSDPDDTDHDTYYEAFGDVRWFATTFDESGVERSVLLVDDGTDRPRLMIDER